VSFDFIIVIFFAVLGLLAHVATRKRWLEWILRAIIFISFLLDLLSIIEDRLGMLDRGSYQGLSPWATNVLIAMSLTTLLTLFIHFRRLVSSVLTSIDFLVSGQIYFWLSKKVVPFNEFFASQRIFIPTSIPHMVALFIYIVTAAFLFSGTEPSSFEMPAIPLAVPLPLGQLFSYNGIGLVLLSFCGVGIFVARSPKIAMQRLAWTIPSTKQVGIGIGLIVFSFTYDALWSILTHNLGGQDLASKLAAYNAGTFAVAGGMVPSVILALATALCAGIGEETLIRGALQPTFGILPAAILHGMLHGQFAHAPIFILQVALWSTCMGIVKRYTNTTTTIIGHAGFNFVTTFLFAFNP
jgi:hypothetical protein